jgi:hypothetical protein
MDDRRVPKLEEMDEQRSQRFLAELFSHLSPGEEYELRHEDYVMEMPQSGECIRGGRTCGRSKKRTPTRPASGCAGWWCGMGCEWSRGSTSTAAGRYLRSWPSSSLGTGRCGEIPATTPSRSKHRGGGQNG